MTRDALVGKITAETGFEARDRYSNQIELVIDAERTVSVLSFLKSSGFVHLSNITCIDWIESGRIEIVYNLWSYAEGVHITVKAPVDRDNPASHTAGNLWPHAAVYEQELHEMFGVFFRGNENMGPLFLHNWQDMPPLRKDFDPEEYSRLAYGMLEEEVLK